MDEDEGTYIMDRDYTFRQLSEVDKVKLDNLIRITEATVSDKSWWLKIKPKAREHFLDDTWTLFYGAFDGEKLVAACGLFLNEYEFGESADGLSIPRESCAEIGRCMVLPEYRGQELMLQINRLLVKEAECRDIKNIVAIAHPQNFYSCNSLEKLGMQVKIENTIKDGCLRNVFLMETR